MTDAAKSKPPRQRIAVPYRRVSTDKQDHASQTAPIEACIKERGWKLGPWFEDNDGGGKIDRVGFQKALAHAKLVRGVLVCWDVPRFGRFGFAVTAQIIKELHDAGAAVHFVNEPIDFASEMAPMLLFAAAWGAEKQRLQGAANTKRALAHKAANGVTFGRANPRYGRGPDAMTPKEREKAQRDGAKKGGDAAGRQSSARAEAFAAPLRAFIRDNLPDGATTREIAAFLNGEGVPAPRGGEWTERSVRRKFRTGR